MTERAIVERVPFDAAKRGVTVVDRVELGGIEFTDPKGFAMLHEKGTYVVITGEKLQPGKWKIIAEREI